MFQDISALFVSDGGGHWVAFWPDPGQSQPHRLFCNQFKRVLVSGRRLQRRRPASAGHELWVKLVQARSISTIRTENLRR